MKVRYGHVSNSSSSSFIIGTDKPLDTFESIKEQIFNNAGEATEGRVSHEFYDEPIHIDVLCEWFKNEVDKSTITDYSSLYGSKPDDEYGDSLLSDIGDQIMYRNGEDNQCWELIRDLDYKSERYQELEKERNIRSLHLGKEYLDSRRKEFEGKYLYEVEFADEDGKVGCQLEHGNHWSNVTHIRIGHH